MKNSIIKYCLIAVASIISTQLTSCNSCSHQDNHNPNTSATHDIVYIDTCMSPNDSLIREGSSGMYIPIGKGTAAASTDSNSTGGKTQSTATATPSKQLSQEEIDNRIENSSSTAYKNGKPVNSGGTSGTGQGTGTGSTGNNSRVTTKEDQLRN